LKKQFKIHQKSIQKPSNPSKNDLEKTLKNNPKIDHMAAILHSFARLFPPVERFFSTFSRTPPWTRLLGDLGPPWWPFGSILAVLVPFGSCLVPFWRSLAAEGEQNEHHRPPKTKSIKKRPPKKQNQPKKRTTNTQACKQAQAEPPGRLKWVGGTPEGITIDCVLTYGI